ncbi:MAG: thiamine diphosphokinase [Treponema sp.]|nr:thiamine diphosphokinase [Treponema sp.]
MLGIIFTGGEGPEPEKLRRLIDGHVTDAFIVAADSGLAAAEEAGIKPDCIIGDMDSVDSARLEAYPEECVVRHKPDKDYTDTELALQAVIEKGCDEIWIAGGGGSNRIDHLFAIRSLFEREVFPCRWITESADIYCIDASAKRNVFSCRIEKDAPISVFPLGCGRWKAQSSGLKWPLESLPWDRGFFGLANVAPNGGFSVKAEEGRFMVIIPLFSFI